MMNGGGHNKLSGYTRRLRSLDAFSRMMKVPEDLRTQSSIGGLVSIISLTIIFILFLSELTTFLTPTTTTSLTVDAGLDENMRIHLDLTFPFVNCEILGLDAVDISGAIQLDVSKDVMKTSTSHDGKKLGDTRKIGAVARQKKNVASPSPWPGGCGSCMGAEMKNGECCNTCDDVRKAYERRGWLLVDLKGVPQCQREGITSLTQGEFDPKHGCNIHGDIEISKVAGKILITPGHSFEFNGRTLHDMTVMKDRDLNLSHSINRLSFGIEYPGQVNPLDGTHRYNKKGIGQHEYFVRIVPTSYTSTFGRVIRSNQYSASYFFKSTDPNKGGTSIPGVVIHYDLSPIHVHVKKQRRSFGHFVVQLCAIIGGVFTVAGMVSTLADGILIRAVRKSGTGKLS